MGHQCFGDGQSGISQYRNLKRGCQWTEEKLVEFSISEAQRMVFWDRNTTYLCLIQFKVQVRQRKENDHCIWQNGGLWWPYKNSFGAVVGAKDRLEKAKEWMVDDFGFQIISIPLISKVAQSNKEIENRNKLLIRESQKASVILNRTNKMENTLYN